MVHANCPYCGEKNEVWLLESVRPGEPPPAMRTCDHFGFVGATKYLGAEYAHKEFGVIVGTVAGSYSLEADLMRILNGHFKFFGPVAFAPNEIAKEAARKAVEDFLRVRKHWHDFEAN